MHHFIARAHHINSFGFGPLKARFQFMSISKEAVGVRYTGWAALGRDPQEDTVEYNCPYCGEHGMKAARRTHDQYHFTDGFLQDLQGEMAACRTCRFTRETNNHCDLIRREIGRFRVAEPANFTFELTRLEATYLVTTPPINA